MNLKMQLNVMYKYFSKISKWKCALFMLLLISIATILFPLRVYAAGESLNAVSPLRQQMKLADPSTQVSGGRGFMQPQEVMVKDSTGNPLAGVEVTFEVITNAYITSVVKGTTSKIITKKTDANGHASAFTINSLGNEEGFQVYSKYVGVIQTIQVKASALGLNPVSFNVEVGTVGSSIIDNTPPKMSVSAKDDSGAAYIPGTWTNHAVTIHYDAVDTLSTIKSCTQDQVFQDEGANQSSTGTAIDTANNESSINFGPINIDKNAPVTTNDLSKSASDTWYNGNVLINLKATDSVSGVKSIYYKIGNEAPVEINGDTAAAEVTTEGITEVSYWAVDNTGNAEAAKLVTVKVDKNAPAIVWKQSPEGSKNGWCDSSVNVTLSAKDLCSGVKEIHYIIGTSGVEQNIEGDTTSFSFSTEGITSITYWAVDNAGYISTKEVKEVKIDKTIPYITVPKNIVLEATALKTPVSIGTAEVSDISEYTLTNDDPKNFPIGINTVTWTATDSVGKVSSVVQTVYVKDTTNPVLTVQGDLIVEAAGIETPVELGEPKATDIFNVIVTNDAPAYFPLGKRVVTWTAKDANGNTVTAVQNVAVVDSVKPVIVAPPNKTLEATAKNTPVDIGTATATDMFECTITNNGPSVFPIGSTILVWKAEDINGNVSLAEQVITITDTTKPALVIPKDITVEATDRRMKLDIGKSEVSDIFDTLVINDALADYPVGTTNVTWTAKDENGNISQGIQKIIVTDTTKPDLTIPEDLVVEATAVMTPIDVGTPTVTDVFDVKVTNTSPQNFSIGKTTITWTAKDANGNVSQGNQSITVVDTTKPLLSIPSDITAEAKGVKTQVNIGTPTVTDIFEVKVTNDALAEYPLGTTTVTWKAEDKNGNISIAKQYITVKDTTKPVLKVPSDITKEASGLRTGVDLGIWTATDIFKVNTTNNAPNDFPLGTHIITWKAIDENGNESTASQKVTIIDTTAPVLSIPADMTMEATSVRTAVYLENATAIDIFGFKITNNALADYPLGETIVKWTAKDVNGNESSKEQKVTIIDTTAPLLSIPADITMEATGVRTKVDLGSATATDIFEFKITNNALADYTLGETLVTWTAKDVNGNESTKVQKVTIVDTTAPVLSIPADITMEATSVRTAVYLESATATDIFGFKIANNALADYPLGETLVTWTAKDVNGNESTKVQKVTIVDTTAPVLSIPADITMEATSVRTAVYLENATAIDIFGFKITNNALADYPLGETIVKWTAKDENGNESTKVQKVTIIDKTAPVLSIPVDITMEATAVRTKVDLGSAMATDIFEFKIANNALTDYPLGETLVSWTAKDVNGNESTKVQKVTIIDKTAPVLSIPADITMEATAVRTKVDLGIATATDIFGFKIANNALTDYPLGETLVSWTAKDVNGNESTKVQKVTIVDKTAPVLSIPADITLEATEVRTKVDLGSATATDIFGFEITNNALADYPLGETLVTWTAKDLNGNESTKLQKVTIVDKTAPVLSIPQDITKEATAVRTKVDLGSAMATDIFGFEIANNALTDYPLGETLVTWTAKDLNGNESTKLQKVTIIDKTAPVLSIPADITMEATAVRTKVDLGNATATDIFEFNITNNALADYPLGETIVKWTAKDVNGNESTKVQKVTIVDKTAPVLSIPADITLEATAVRTKVDLGSATATDIFGFEIANNALAVYPLGETLVTWTAKDVNGNESTKVQKVIIVDKTAPVLSIPQDITLEATAVRTKVDLGSAMATDIFGFKIANNALTDYPLGETIVKWTAKDVNGNDSTKVQKVTIVDKTAPVLSIPADITLEATAVRTKVDLGSATATDIFEFNIANNALTDYPLGETLVTWTAKDVNGNESTKVQKITIIDTTKSILIIPADITVIATGSSTSITLGIATATDIFGVTVSNDAPTGFPVGKTQVTWTATDSNGNKSTAVQNVTVVQGIKLKEYNNTRKDRLNCIDPIIQLENTGSTSINLSDVKIRYYYTVDSEKKQIYWCDYASLYNFNRHTNITQFVVGNLIKSDSKTGSDYYLEISFTDNAGSLKPGGKAQIQNRFAKYDWSKYTQTNDYSFNSSAKDFTDNERVTVYLSDVVVSGTEP